VSAAKKSIDTLTHLSMTAFRHANWKRRGAARPGSVLDVMLVVVMAMVRLVVRCLGKGGVRKQENQRQAQTQKDLGHLINLVSGM